MKPSNFLFICSALMLSGCGVKGKPQVPDGDEDMMQHSYPKKSDDNSQSSVDGF